MTDESRTTPPNQHIENKASNLGAQGIFYGDVNISHGAPIPSKPGSAPPLPALVIGREDDLDKLKARLGIRADTSTPTTPQVMTAVRGWPGVGKTTLAATLAHDPAVSTTFPDGVLWASLGESPSIFAELAAWCRALGVPDLVGAKSVEELSTQLAALLRNKRMLLIVDDVWDARDAKPFNVGGRGCAILVTTRLPEVARAIAPAAGDVYVLGVLSDENALALLWQLAPEVVAGAEEASLELVREIEGLPLAIQVAGRLLHAESSYGLDVTKLLADLREGARLLAQDAPLDRVDPVTGVTPTVAVLLRKSTERLDAHTLDCFAYLGAFAPKPATFDTAAMKSVWEADDPLPTVRTLVDRGLLEPTGNGRFWMHAILVAHARSFLTD